MKLKGKSEKPEQKLRVAALALDLALLKSAGHDGPLLYPGPLCSGGRVEDQPAG
ncbi:hypothetical protein I6J77_14460 [Rhodanobacter sp. FDAARGOS 1247]|uniref:hypothetical protein n=1 Tax=Rhodanobacter sp. FDAARGOS 1247 TaxID=2778082 RepID=UPI001951E101|nr:hypothetical protein [Rhodanobacter sp. FDAARGOS 1247]QRP63299.1 hypothetical protein I6J77_14460 [Rhodanobacter sp. FDAARGOS 1247]